MKTLVISDLHLGARNSMTDYLEIFLREVPFDQLVLNGDTIDDLNFKKFKPRHWRVMKLLRQLVREDRLVLIRGNHDEQTKKGVPANNFDILPYTLGIKFIDELPIDTPDGKYLILHGHRFDPSLNWPILIDVADWCYRSIQRINKRYAKWVKHQAKEVGGIIESVRQGSTKYAAEQGYAGVITGHTHYHEDSNVNKVRFLNCGSWVDDPCYYVHIDDKRVGLVAYPKET